MIKGFSPQPNKEKEPEPNDPRNDASDLEMPREQGKEWMNNMIEKRNAVWNETGKDLAALAREVEQKKKGEKTKYEMLT